jgi:TolB-like protein/Flp pilus assembly protein TadD
MLTPRPSGPIRSLAVLPFVNLSNIADQEYFADGMTEQLINTLGQVGALRIISRTSIIQYKQTKKGLKEIAKELNVDAVVEGSVQREGERVRISAQLIRAPEDRQLWAQSYERELREVLLLQGEIAQAIVGQVKAKLTAQEKTRVTSAKPVDPEAQDAYLRGSYFQNQWTEQSIRHAIGYFEQAVAHDSTYAQAYAGLAEANMTLGGAGIEVESPADGYRKGRPFLLKALALDEDNADAHMWMANLKSESDLDYAGAEKEYRRVLELNPNHAVAMCGYAQLMNTLGRYEEALAATKRAVEVDPLTPWVHSSLVIRYTCAGRYEEALAEARRALASNPNFWITYWAMGKTYQEMGRWNEAIAADQKAVELSEGNANVRGDLGFALARAGRREAALGVLKAFDDEARMHHIPAYARAVVYSGLGDNEAAIAWLEKAESEHSEMVKWISFKGNFSEIRDDPRFRAIMCRMKLPGACQ